MLARLSDVVDKQFSSLAGNEQTMSTTCNARSSGSRCSHALNGLLASSLILRLDHPSSLTGDTHLCFGRVVLLSPIQNHP